MIASFFVTGATPAPAETSRFYTDVPEYWATHAINRTAVDHAWLFVGGTKFYPRALLTRKLMARAVVRAFAPLEVPDPTIVLPDMPETHPFYRWANIATKLGWIQPNAKGKFDPEGTVSKRSMDRTLVLALGLKDAARGLRNMTTADGYVFKKPSNFAALVLANELHLNYNYHNGQDGKDLYPWQPVAREYFAFALSHAKNAQSGWGLWSVQSFASITLPKMSDGRKKMVNFAIQYVGYPYVYAAEWYRKVSSGYCCGSQPHGGFDCSGFQWWVAQRSSSGFPVAKVRPYNGWHIGQRRASLIAKESDPEDRHGVDYLKAGDLIFFDADGDDSNWRNIDHGGVSLGGDWFIHSSGSRGGVSIGNLGEGSYWHEAFVTSRRFFP